MSNFLTTASVMQCPHGGMVSATPGSTKSKAGAPVLRPNDTFTVAGCPFTQSPCASVEWPSPAGKTKVDGQPVLRQDDIGLCKSGAGAPQGSVIVSTTQPKAAGG
ncbi:MAG: hypothetical protein QM820_35200 [Minicystis sp.]